MEIVQEMTRSKIALSTKAFCRPRDLHWHNNYEICQVSKNKCRFLVNGEDIEAVEGDFVITTGYDHAGKYECSILMALYPDAVKLDRIGDIPHWFTKSSAEANVELGEEMVKLSLKDLEKRIV